MKKGKNVPNPDLSPLAASILADLNEFCEVLESGEPVEQRYTVRSIALNLTPREYEAGDVKHLRAKLGVSQAVFAHFLGVSAAAVRAWERNARPIPASSRRFMDEIAADTGLFFRRMEAATKAT
jgi:putative transcriptional regulator